MSKNQRKPYPTERGLDKLDEGQRRHLLRAYAEGVSFRELQSRFGVGRETVHKLAADYGVDRLPLAPSGAPGAYTIKQFCEAFSISDDTFLRIRREGRGPAIMKVGTRVLISFESAEAWLRECEKRTSESNQEFAER